MAIVLPKFPRRRASALRTGDARPAVSLRCCRADGRYAPGDMFECSWRVERLAPECLQGLEISLLWYTEGKGDEDISVHFFRRLSAARLREMDLAQPQKFISLLPESPLSYNGHLLRIRWCVRMRLFLAGGQEILTEQPFTIHAAQDAPAAQNPAAQVLPAAQNA